MKTLNFKKWLTGQCRRSFYETFTFKNTTRQDLKWIVENTTRKELGDGFYLEINDELVSRRFGETAQTPQTPIKQWIYSKILKPLGELRPDDDVGVAKAREGVWDVAHLDNNKRAFVSEPELANYVKSVREGGKPVMAPSIEELRKMTAPMRQKAAAPAAQVATAPTATKTGKSWIYAKVKEDIEELKVGEDVGVSAADDGSWEIWSFDGDRMAATTRSDLPQVVTSIKKDPADPKSYYTAPTLNDLFKLVEPLIEKPKEEDKKGKYMKYEDLSEEQQKIDKRFEQMMANKSQSHMVISALAGTGKTSTLKHLAWKYGKPDQKWLYLVFNTKNKVEATEKFPTTFVDVRTTNGFLGNLLGSDENIDKVDQTERLIQVLSKRKKGKHQEMPDNQNAAVDADDDEDNNTPMPRSKMGEVVDGPAFASLLKKLNIPDTDESERIIKGMRLDKYAQAAAIGCAKDIRYTFKEEAQRIADLGKAYGVDPRKNETVVHTELEKIFKSYDIKTGLSEVKERIRKYRQPSLIREVQTALKNILGYDFMQKTFKDEMTDAAIWLLKASLPHGTDQTLNYKGVDYELGQMRDFSDDIWLAAINAHDMHWPHYDVVLADEVQDFNPCQKLMLQKLHEAGAKIVAVGDENQCHPAGTMIALTGGGSKPIEDIKVGDEVVTYNSKKDRFPGVNTQGRKILEKAVRHYAGQMVRIKTASTTLDCTPNHRCLVKFPNNQDMRCLYLMVKGQSARVGICPIGYKDHLGIVGRANTEKAERVWILDVFETRQAAQMSEIKVSQKFGLPQLVFCTNSSMKLSQNLVTETYNEMGDLLDNAKRCLAAFGRSWEFPIWKKGKHERDEQICQNYLSHSKTCVIQAANLISGMQMRVFAGDESEGNWEQVAISKINSQCDVYSLSVEPTEQNRRLYIANNIVVGNSIYRFRGADGDAFKGLGKMLNELSADKDTHHSLSINFRSRKNILDHVNAHGHVTGLKHSEKKFPGGGGGTVTNQEINYGDVFGTLKKEYADSKQPSGKPMAETAFIARTNEPLVQAALKMLGDGVPFIIVGRDVSNELMKHINRVLKDARMKDSEPAIPHPRAAGRDSLGKKLEEYQEKENKRWGSMNSKKAHLQEINATSEALYAALASFSGMQRNTEEMDSRAYDAMMRDVANKPLPTIKQFKMWLKAKLSGFDVQDNEGDLKEFRQKVKKDHPVVLTTAHKSKGLEFSRVYVLREDQFPHPKAEREEDRVQEENARYVVHTRAQDELHIVKLKGQPGYKEPQEEGY